jgi:hypothetical protein
MDLVHCPVTGAAVPKGQERVDVFVLSSEDGIKPCFWKVMFSTYLQFQTMDNVHELSDSE